MSTGTSAELEQPVPPPAAEDAVPSCDPCGPGQSVELEMPPLVDQTAIGSAVQVALL
jgi:hypothetical protein